MTHLTRCLTCHESTFTADAHVCPEWIQALKGKMSYCCGVQIEGHEMPGCFGETHRMIACGVCGKVGD